MIEQLARCSYVAHGFEGADESLSSGSKSTLPREVSLKTIFAASQMYVIFI
jgi:hypothetical protein